jgi:histidine ammonia-lyase
LIIQEYISYVKNKSFPFPVESSLKKISEERELALTVCKSHKVYGFNTLPGHRDSESIDEINILDFQKELIASHNISNGNKYSDSTISYFIFCKLYSLNNSKTGISPSAYEAVFNMYKNGDGVAYQGASYSCGDVIPAASLFKNIKNLSKGDAMSLINGNFIHVGLCLSLSEKLNNTWVSYKHQTNEWLKLVPTNKGIINNALIDLKKIGITTRYNIKTVQDPVSIRALPDIFHTLLKNINNFFSEITRLMNTPSGNPLFDFHQMEPLSQGSYMSPSLSLITSTLIDSILLLLWSIDSRTKYILSGKVEHISKDNADKGTLGLIQFPKLMTAKLETARRKFSSRVFVTGSNTSYGTEDLWSFGLDIAEELSAILEITDSVLELERKVLNSIKKSQPRKKLPDLFQDIANSTSLKKLF